MKKINSKTTRKSPMLYINQQLIKRLTIIGFCGLVTACQTTMVQPTPVAVGDPNAKTPATGSAGGAAAINPSVELAHCDRPVGTMGLNQTDESAFYRHERKYGLQSPANMLRLFAQQSNCFVVVERGHALESTEFERQLEESGELAEGSNFGKGQLVAADYSLSPQLVFHDRNARGSSGGLGALIGTVFAGGSSKTKYKEAQVLLTMIDNRSGIQLLIAEGSAVGADKEVFVGALALPFFGGFAQSHAKTTTEKIIVGAYLDAFNNIVAAVNNYEPQQSVGGQGHGKGGALKIDGQVISE